MKYLKEWKTHKISIGEFEDLWEANTRFEVAKAYISLLKEVESISQEDKAKFLAKIASGCQMEGERLIDYRDPENEELGALAVKTFFEIVPAWDKGLEAECWQVLIKLGEVLPEHRKGWEGKAKTFVHSFLNTEKKEDDSGWQYTVPSALIALEMFEELVNYNFTGQETLELLNKLIRPENPLPSMFYLGESRFLEALGQNILWALKENREPHAVSALLRLLAKRGGLEKIFQTQTPESK